MSCPMSSVHLRAVTKLMCSQEQCTPLHCAARGGTANAVEPLMRVEARINAVDKVSTARLA